MINSLTRAQRVACTAAFAALVAVAPNAPACAGTYDVGPGGLYEAYAGNTCNITVCDAIFSKVPAGKTLLVKHITCQIEATSNAYIVEARLQSTNNARRTYFSAVWTGTYGRKYFTANAEASHMVSGTWTPSIDVVAKPGLVKKLDCTIAGVLLNG